MFRSYMVSANDCFTCGVVSEDLNNVSTDRPVAQDSTSTDSERKVVDTIGNEMDPLDAAISSRKFFANCSGMWQTSTPIIIECCRDHKSRTRNCSYSMRESEGGCAPSID